MDDIDTKYDKLRAKISRWPVRFPASEEVLPILKLLFEPEEVELLCSDAFSAPYMDQATISSVAEKAGKSEEEAEQILNKLADKGVLFRFKNYKTGEINYSLFPVLPGFFEFYLVGEGDENRRNKFSKLFEDYYKKELVAELGSSSYPWVRVLPAEKNLKVNLEIDTTLEVLSFEKVSEYIQTSKKVALMNCACRIKNPCEHLKEACICFDKYADFMVERGLARYLEVDSAVEALKEFETQGLVHTTTNSQIRPQFICNCCTCSCLVLRGLTEFDNPRCFTKSNFIPEWNQSDCNYCEVCIDICPMNAIQTNELQTDNGGEAEKNSITINSDKCIGCGLCASNCREDALLMLKVRNNIPEESLRGMWKRMELERGKNK